MTQQSGYAVSLAQSAFARHRRTVEAPTQLTAGPSLHVLAHVELIDVEWQSSAEVPATAIVPQQSGWPDGQSPAPVQARLLACAQPAEQPTLTPASPLADEQQT